jgi:hypothetical protein
MGPQLSPRAVLLGEERFEIMPKLVLPHPVGGGAAGGGIGVDHV